MGKGQILVASSVFLLLALLTLEVWILKERKAHLHTYEQLNFSRNPYEILANARTFREVKDTLVFIWAIKICFVCVSLSVGNDMRTG